MNKNMFEENVPLNDRLQRLKDNSDTQEHGPYVRNLTQDELDQRRESLADNCIEKSRLEGELKAVKAKFKGEIEPLNSENALLCREIKTKQAEFEGHTLGFADQENGMMNFYDDRGDWIGSRRLKPEEKNNLFTAHKTAM